MRFSWVNPLWKNFKILFHKNDDTDSRFVLNFQGNKFDGKWVTLKRCVVLLTKTLQNAVFRCHFAPVWRRRKSLQGSVPCDPTFSCKMSPNGFRFAGVNLFPKSDFVVRMNTVMPSVYYFTSMICIRLYTPIDWRLVLKHRAYLPGIWYLKCGCSRHRWLATCLFFAALRKAISASAVYATASPSVRPSVRHTPVLCQNEGTQWDAVFTTR